MENVDKYMYGPNLGQDPCGSHTVWYLIVSIPDLCTLTYFAHMGPTSSCVAKTIRVSYEMHIWDPYRLPYLDNVRPIWFAG